jgi:hypothetical protein
MDAKIRGLSEITPAGNRRQAVQRQPSEPRGQCARTERLWSAVTCAVVGTGSLLRCYQINAFPGLNPDEVEIALQWFRHPVIYWYVAPSGRPQVNPLELILLWPFAAFAAPAPWVVRMPAVLAGLLLLPVTFVVMSKAFDRSTATLATLLVSSAPVLIAYSRLGWDPAFIPVVTALAIGFAFRRRWVWTSVSMMLLALIHPTAVFLIPIVAAPLIVQLWRCSDASQHRALWPVGLTLVSIASVVLAIAASDLRIALETMAHRLGDVWSAAEFASGYWHVLEGSLIYVGFLGGRTPPPALGTGLVFITVCASGTYLLWRQGRVDAATLLVTLPFALFAQYLTMGAQPSSELHERYVLWAVVPSCLAIGFVIQAVCARLQVPSLVVALVLSLFWMGSFYSNYLQPFEHTGGTSVALSYRSAIPQPREQVLAVIRSLRQYPATNAKVFVGESRLHLGLMYLASQDKGLDIRNLGSVFYWHFQSDDRPDLLKSYEQYDSRPYDVFFVDYAWEELEGGVQGVPEAGRPVATVVAPWTARELQAIHTPDGRPLLKIWRLSRP